MSISDELMWKYYVLCTDLLPAQIEAKKEQVASGALHPMEAKKELARSIISEFIDAKAADDAEAEFRKIFSERRIPTEVERKTIEASVEPVPVVKILVAAGLVPTNNEARRLLAQGGVTIDDRRLDDLKETLDATAGRSYTIKAGKRRFAQVVFE